jgi:hypothetical protein
MSKLSRRSLVTTAAALPAITVPAAAEPYVVDDELVALADRAGRAFQVLDKGFEPFNVLDERVLDWRRQNPKPEWSAFGTWADEGARFVSKDGVAKKDDYYAAVAEWKRQKEAFERECGYAELREANNAKLGVFLEVLEKMAEKPALSIRGIVAKARAARLNPDIADDRDLLQSIIDDLLALGAA